MARGTRVNFAAFRARYHLQNTPLDVPWVQDVTPDEIADDFDGWEAEVQALVEVRLFQMSRHNSPDRFPTLPFLVCGRDEPLGNTHRWAAEVICRWSSYPAR